jgi:hypothetical protein
MTRGLQSVDFGISIRNLNPRDVDCIRILHGGFMGMAESPSLSIDLGGLNGMVWQVRQPSTV